MTHNEAENTTNISKTYRQTLKKKKKEKEQHKIKLRNRQNSHAIKNMRRHRQQ